MLELQTLGTVGLRHRDAGQSVAQVVQPKRLAILAYLALAPRRRYRRRDTIVTLFWPDSDQPHARGALSQSLRYLRRSLGEGAIVTLGEDEVGLDRELVGCDAVVFADRCEAAQFEEALAIYQGPFLDGFFVSDAGPEFERWVAGERMRLGHQAGEAAKTLSERAEGRTDPAAAVRWARRAALLGRGDEAAAARLIRLLDQVGDRAGALREYDALRQRLKEEFQVPPSPETQRLITLILGR